jgi:hypothetical protein
MNFIIRGHDKWLLYRLLTVSPQNTIDYKKELTTLLQETADACREIAK